MESSSRFFNTFWSLLPPIIAIALALITKEVYSSLFIGIVVGGLLYSNFAFEATVLHVFNDGIVASVTDSYNMGILIFLVILGAMVCLMNKAGDIPNKIAAATRCSIPPDSSDGYAPKIRSVSFRFTETSFSFARSVASLVFKCKRLTKVSRI